MNIITHLKIAMALKKYTQIWFDFVVLPFCVIIVALSWKFESDLKRVKELRDRQIGTIEKMIAPSTAAEKMNDTWRVADEDAALFSAYLDSRPEVVLEETFNLNGDYSWALIRIVAILEVGTDSSGLRCYYKFAPPNGEGPATTLERPAVGARLIATSENFKMRYSAAFVLCQLISAEDGRLPSGVTFSSRSGRTADELLGSFVDVRYTRPASAPSAERFMAACVPSLHHGYANHENLLEFVEFYRMMGVNHFTFYNTSASATVSRVLDYYVARGLATVVQWKLPAVYKFERNLRYNGIFAALNDCLYRNSMVGGFTYVLNVDLDEFIVPRSHDNFQHMMEHLDPSSESSTKASFVFRNVFFYLMYDDDLSVVEHTDKPKLMLQAKTTRYTEIYEAYSRSKYIARGENVIEMGNHRVWRPRKIGSALFDEETIVNPELALLHHYRSCEVNELVCWLRETVVDTTAHTFTGELGRRVTAVLAKILG